MFNFVGQGYPRKLFNLEHFPIYGIIIITEIVKDFKGHCIYSYMACNCLGKESQPSGDLNPMQAPCKLGIHHGSLAHMNIKMHLISISLC